jgi:hypothetical protein
VTGPTNLNPRFLSVFDIAWRLSDYLEQPTGSPDVNLVNMAREGLRTALHKAARNEAHHEKRSESRLRAASAQR